MKLRILLSALAMLVLAACGSSSSKQSAPERKAVTHQKTRKLLDPKAVGANELAQIPVIMYHRVISNPESVYDSTPKEFRSELLTLYRQGYRPITAAELVTGNIDVPAGKTPVVLTFDDSSASQFGLLPNGEVDPKTAVGILLAFARKHPGFRATGTFYVIATLFERADGQRLLAELASLGFDIGDHTLDHANLGDLDPVGVQRQLVLGKRLINDAVPELLVRTVALPYGVYPEPRRLALRGSWDGESYTYSGVFEVGSGPAPSPYSIEFDPLGIPRIESEPWKGEEDFGSGYWLNYFKLHPERRFYSDGNPERISFPRIFSGAVVPKWQSRANPY